MKLKQRVVIAAEMFRQLGYASDDLVEHSAQSLTIDHAGLNGEADDAPSELIHHYHHPVRLQKQRFTTKQIDAPEAVLGMSEKSEPRWTAGVACRPTMFGEYPPHNILFDLDTT
jgi:hypothetical protein